MDWRLVQAALVLVAFVAMLESPPKMIYVEGLVPLLGGRGSALDQGPWGHSMLARLLAEEGYRVELSILAYHPAPGERVVVIAPAPRLCNTSLLAAVLYSWRERGVHVALVALAERGCPALEAAERVVANATVKPLNELLYAGYHAVPCSAPEAHILFIGYTVYQLDWEPRGACRPIAYAIHEAAPVGVACGDNLVAYGDEHLFTNTLLSTPEARTRQLLGYTLRLLHADPRNTTIILPVELYPRKSLLQLPLPIAVHPAVIAAYLASRLPAAEEAFTDTLSSINPLLPPLLAATLVAAALLAAQPRGGARGR